MRLPLRTRVVTGIYDRLLSADIATMTPRQLARARTAPPATGPAALVFGRPEPGVRWEDTTVAGDGGARLAVRVATPARPATGPRPLLVHLHGGGWVVGNHRAAAWLCSGLADAVDAVVASVDYRMAPEHRFPTAVLDCLAATADLAARADALGADPARVAGRGDSAGGNRSAAVALLARDAGGPALAAQVLVYPATDATLSSPSVHRLAHAPVLDLDDIHGYRAHYLGPDGDPTDPRVSPLLAASHAGLPPALVQTAEHDPLVDDGARYAQALREAGVPVRYTRYEGVPHGFLSIPGVVGAPAFQARAEIAQFLAETL